MSRDPLQRREARFAKRRCALQSGSLTAGLQGAQATARQRRRDRNGRCRPGFHASDRSVSPKPRQRVRRSLAGAPAAARRSRARRPDAVRQPGAEGARATGSRLTYCFTLIKPAIPLAVAYRDRRRWQRRGLKLPGQREPGVSPGKAP